MATFLELLYGDAPREAYDALLAELGEQAAAEHALALQIRDRMELHRGREAELSALYDTANDLTAIRDLDTVLTAIVRRARQLLRADMTYLSLNDEEEGASYMKVTDGALTPDFAKLRLPLGTGLLGLVAQTGAPYFTEDYQSDDRFVHRDFIDAAVAGEGIRAILGVPLVVDDTVIGALLAVHRTVRPFPPREVALLSSFAAHAAVALENARLFEQARAAVADADAANRELRLRSESVESAARVHDRLTDALLEGADVAGVADVIGDALHGQIVVYDESQRVLVGDAPAPRGLSGAIDRARHTGRSVELGPGTYVAVAAAGDEHLGTLLVRAGELDLPERRTLERGALVVALVLLFRRTEAEAEERVRGELLTDVLTGAGDPALLRERARRRQATLDEPLVLAVADVGTGDVHRAARVAGRLAREHRGLSAAHDGRVVLAAPDTDALGLGAELRSRLAGDGDGDGEPITIGVVTAGPGPEALVAAYPDARRCLDTLIALGRAGEVSDPARLGLARLLIGASGPEDLSEFVEGALGPVLSYDEQRGADLTATLEAWFAAGGHLRATAETLHVHPNTVAQRLERIGRLLGDDWREPARSLDLQLALRVRRLRVTSG